MFSRTLVLFLISALGAETSFYLLFSVVPLYATTSISHAGKIGAGLATGTLMFSTVAGELAMSHLLARFGYRPVYVAGLLLLGAPALALLASASMPTIIAVCVVRGLGFAVIVVVGTLLAASLVPHERRGEGLGLYGVVVGIPAIVALPLGVWLADHIGYPPIFIAGAVAALAVLAVLPGLPAQLPGREPAPTVGLLAGLRTPALIRPLLVFSSTTIAAGVVLTFLPLAVKGASGTIAAVALFAQSLASTLTRWWAGRYGDRYGSAGLLIPGILGVSIGLFALVLTGSPAAVVAAMLLFGAGFGVIQNASLTLLFAQVSTSSYGTASALWNLAYDGGLGLGAAGFGALVSWIGYPAGFAVIAALVSAALVPARREQSGQTARRR
jgi:predicted MFS family arabinose efflux permease